MAVQTQTKSSSPPPVLLSKETVLERLGGVSESSLYHYMLKLDFPRPIELGKPDGRVNRGKWFEDEVTAWIKSRPRRKIGGLKEIHNRQGRPRKKQRAAR